MGSLTRFSSHGFRSCCWRSLISFMSRGCSSSSTSIEIERQNSIFNAERNRQKELVGRIEKITVLYTGLCNRTELVMNKSLSTPYDVAKHLGERVMQRSAVAVINGETLWHMHQPLTESCNIDYLHFMSSDPYQANKAFWRTCSFLLGAVITNAFKDTVSVKLHSFPSPNVRSGSFVYDIQLSLDDWQPTESELKVLSIEMIKLCQQDLLIETLSVEKEVALDIFAQNPHKSQQIPDIALHYGGKVTLFRAGSHIDISRGPMISSTEQIGRITVANVFKLDTKIEGDPIYRFQGVALPHIIALNHYAYKLVENRARDLNCSRIPTTFDENALMSQVN